MKVKNKFLLAIAVILVAITAVWLFDNSTEEYDIEEVFEQAAYQELPEAAKDIVRDYYESTGEILKLESEKEPGELYLNPEYVAYAEMSAEQQQALEVLPEPILEEYAPLEESEAIDGAGLPSVYDLRNVAGVDYLNANGSQGSLGICWAFSTITALESHIMFAKRWPTVRLSERQIDYATSTNGIKAFENGFFGKRTLTTGGNFSIATRVLAQGISAFNSTDFVSDYSTDVLDYATVMNTADSQFEVNSTIAVPVFNSREYDMTTQENIEKRAAYIDEVKTYVMAYGGAYAGTMSPQSKCGYIDSSSGMYLVDVESNCYDSTKGHAMTIVGWDDNLEYDYCITSSGTHSKETSGCASDRLVSGQGAWLLRNSWGASYSYLYLAYDSSDTSIGFVTDVTRKSERNWTNAYQAGGDTGYMWTGYKFDLSSLRIKGSETLKAVKGYTYESQTGFKVIVRDASGTTVASKSVYPTRPGYFTADFSAKDVKISSDYKIYISSLDGASFISTYAFVFTDSEDTESYAFDDLTLEASGSQGWIWAFLNTKNIPSKSVVSYTIEDPDGYDYSDRILLEEGNTVGVDKLYVKASFASYTPSQDYKIYINYGGKKLAAGTVKVNNSDEFNYHTISFAANGGTGTVESLIVPANDASYHLRKNQFTREDYRFIGWNTKADGSGTNYAEGDLVNIHADTTLYANWQEITYTVTTYANDGSDTFDSYEIHNKEQLRKNTYTQDGYVFDGWNTKADGSGTAYKDEEIFTLKADLTLYAQWSFDAATLVSSSVYSVSGTTIINVAQKTSLTTYLNNISTKAGFAMEVDMNGKSYIGTGSKTTIYKDGEVVVSLTNIVAGDVDGNGMIAMMDYIKVRNHLTKAKILDDSAQLLAADANQDNKVSMLDYIRIRNTILSN